MDIKGALIGAGAAIVIGGGGFVGVLAANANDDVAAPESTKSPSTSPSISPTPTAVPSTSATPGTAHTPAPAASTPPEDAVTEPAPPVAPPVAQEPAPAPAVYPSVDPLASPATETPDMGQPQTVIQPENPGDPLLIPGDDPSRVVINP